MHPIIPILMPLRCDVFARILAVVSCKSKSVRPQEGQLIYSVFDMRVLVACKIPNDVEFISWIDCLPCNQIPSPNPSINETPRSEDVHNWNVSGSSESTLVVRITGFKTPFSDRKSTRLNSSHRCSSYAVFCLKKKKKHKKKKKNKQHVAFRHHIHGAHTHPCRRGDSTRYLI